MNKKTFLILFFVLFNVFFYDVLATTSTNDDFSDGRGSGVDTPSSPTSWPTLPETNAESQIHMIGMTKVINAEGLTQNGNSFHVDSAKSIYTTKFVFNDVINVDITAENGKLTKAVVTSSKDDNVFFIKNPIDEIEIEKIKIYLNKTQTLDYKFDSENVSITIPQNSKFVLEKGFSYLE